MSYTERRSASVPYDGSAHYSGSQGCSCGRSVSYSGSVSYNGYVDVNVEVEVNTYPFDNAVNNCEKSVDILTGTVVATETAHISQINKSADDISGTLISGFFKTVMSEITQQTALLENEINSTLLHLQDSKGKVHLLKKQMKKDYNRISERYVKTFNDLNNELENRILAIDGSAFKFEKSAKENMSRILNTGLVGLTAVFGKESGNLQALISIASAKRNALNAIEKSKKFLKIRKTTDDIIADCTLNESVKKRFFVPVCFTQAQDKNFSVHLTAENESLSKAQICGNVFAVINKNEARYEKVNPHDLERIKSYFNAYTNEKYNSVEPKTKRVKEMLQKISDFNAIRSVK